jgi:hypothetical protein
MISHPLWLQVTVQTEHERQLDKIRRKEEKRLAPNVVQMLELMISVLMISHPSSWQVKENSRLMI